MTVSFIFTPATQLTPGGKFLITKMYAAFKPQGGFEVVKQRQISTPARDWTRFTEHLYRSLVIVLTELTQLEYSLLFY